MNKFKHKFIFLISILFVYLFRKERTLVDLEEPELKFHKIR